MLELVEREMCSYKHCQVNRYTKCISDALQNRSKLYDMAKTYNSIVYGNGFTVVREFNKRLTNQVKKTPLANKNTV